MLQTQHWKLHKRHCQLLSASRDVVLNDETEPTTKQWDEFLNSNRWLRPFAFKILGRLNPLKHAVCLSLEFNVDRPPHFACKSRHVITMDELKASAATKTYEDFVLTQQNWGADSKGLLPNGEFLVCIILVCPPCPHVKMVPARLSVEQREEILNPEITEGMLLQAFNTNASRPF